MKRIMAIGLALALSCGLFITAAFADHNPMDDTERLFREMLVYAETGEDPHFAACCSELSAMLKATYETHGFSLKNIL